MLLDGKLDILDDDRRDDMVDGEPDAETGNDPTYTDDESGDDEATDSDTDEFFALTPPDDCEFDTWLCLFECNCK